MTVSDPDDELFFGLPLTTARVVQNLQHSSSPLVDYDADSSYFLYEATIAAISIVFFRCTVPFKKDEPVALRYFFAAVLGFLAYSKKSYTLISAVELFSYLVPTVLGSNLSVITAKLPLPLPDPVLRLILIAVSGGCSLIISQYAASGDLLNHFRLLTPDFITNIFLGLIPIEEVTAAYNIMAKFQKKDILDRQINHLFFVTFHMQVRYCTLL